MSIKKYFLESQKARKKILKMIYEAQTSHIASNMSVIDIATVLYANLEREDDVVWSKGWVAAAIYYFLAQQNKIPKKDLNKFAKKIKGEIKYLALAETNIPGVHVNGGSVGHGLPIAAGLAWLRDGIIHCIMSDGELNEGSTWEAINFVGFHKLNLITWIDNNRFQAMGQTRDILNMELLEKKFGAFGWNTTRIDGHDFRKLEDIFKNKNYPLAVICDTKKGKGIKYMEDKLDYHYLRLTRENYNQAIKQLNERKIYSNNY